MLKLSFCIPVYNFGLFVGDAIDSILKNKSKLLDFEILVLDGGSTDNTRKVMEEYVARESCIRYVRQEERGGIDNDLNRCIKLATGDYCWLVSGDDRLRENIIGEVIRWLHLEHDVYLCRHTQCDLNFNFLYDYPIFSSEEPALYELSNPDERLAYLEKALNTEALFSFMSGLIIKKSKWISVDDPKDFMKSCWGHVARLLSLAETQLKVCYVGDLWIDRRGDNDSFLEHGVVHRIAIAVDGYQKIASKFFNTNTIQISHVRRMVRKDLGFLLFLHAKALAYEKPLTESRSDLDRLVSILFSDKNIGCYWSKTVYQLVPVRVYLVLRSVRRIIRGATREIQYWGK